MYVKYILIASTDQLHFKAGPYKKLSRTVLLELSKSRSYQICISRMQIITGKSTIEIKARPRKIIWQAYMLILHNILDT